MCAEAAPVCSISEQMFAEDHPFRFGFFPLSLTPRISFCTLPHLRVPQRMRELVGRWRILHPSVCFWWLLRRARAYACGGMALRNRGVVARSCSGIVAQQDVPAAMSEHFGGGEAFARLCSPPVFSIAAARPCSAPFARAVAVEWSISRRYSGVQGTAGYCRVYLWGGKGGGECLLLVTTCVSS